MKRRVIPLYLALTCLISSSLYAEETTETQKKLPPVNIAKTAPIQSFEPFTGKVVKNKVRLRLQPNLDGPVLRELNRDQLVVVLNQTDDFYAIQPLADMKAYIFRTYVLDNVIEGTRVNVRLQPDLDAPVISQLNSGDRVEGSIYANNTKWLQINIPGATRFYVAKEYIEKIGDAGYIARLEQKKNDVYHLLNTTKAVSEAEMQKNFDQIHLEGIIANYKRIIFDYKEFPEAGAHAEEALKNIQEAYTQKKIAFLEHQAHHASDSLEKTNKELTAQKEKLTQLEEELSKEKTLASSDPHQAPAPKRIALPYTMTAWIPAEDALFKAWSMETGNQNTADFYQEQKQQAFTIKGTIDPYNRPVKNKPGDFMLIGTANKLPVAFLYSTQVNLQDYVGQDVTLLVVPRPNFNYAFPAYYVLSLE